jgi:hypothetical protein
MFLASCTNLHVAECNSLVKVDFSVGAAHRLCTSCMLTRGRPKRCEALDEGQVRRPVVEAPTIAGLRPLNPSVLARQLFVCGTPCPAG